MNINDVFSTVILALKKAEIDYLVVGSFASNYHGVARGTQDVDLVVSLNQGDIGKLMDELPNNYVRDPQNSFETVTATTRTIIAEVASQFKVELFDLSEDEFDQERFRRGIYREMFGIECRLATVEDTVIQKIKWGDFAARPKDIEDVRKILAVQGDALDYPYIQSWCDRHGTRALLEKLRAEVAELDL